MSICKNALHALRAQNKVCKAFGVKLITSPEIVHVAHNAGFDSLFIDLEHSALSLREANTLCVAALSVGISPFVRVPGQSSAGFVQRVLDNGAQGVIFPHCDSAEQARAAVRMAKYPPLGKRSVMAMLPHMGYRQAPLTEVTALGNAELSTVVVMIESPEAVRDVDAIAGTEGVDVVLVGSNDLSIELGVPGDWDSPVFSEALARIADAVRRHSKILGVAGIYNRPDVMHECIHRHGARFVLGQNDLPLMYKAAGEVASKLKDLEEMEQVP
ncbi:hypothetical protein BFW01_g5889 [Lasiodiplodia theobromae]|uniref:2-keto-3-deoxy-L-rhamnonate aldolase n=1 Tax=Lasiodiplodia theobromae TaxID=45133 RepID=A0A5N5D0U9_9PEZI|nr:2-keto-3-deoxy-L-rhamnonate aldolase [Lasiodiplodia theobromae]KAF9634994.1 hypothetical protein BFW01_g5889 [Lasiodiplodia theobromae]